MSVVGSKGIPLSKEEVMILLHLIESNPTVTNKLTNSATNRLKEEAWKKITEAFNSMIKSYPRRPDQLKLKWENLKKTARKVIKLRLSRNRIGSSEPVYIPHFKAIKKIADILCISLNYSSNHATTPIVFDDEGSHSLPSSNGLDSLPFEDSEDSSLPSRDIGDSSLSSVKNGESSISSVKNGDSSSTAGTNGNVCVSCGESRNARKPRKDEDGTIMFAENGASSMEFDKNKDSGTQPFNSVSSNKNDVTVESLPSINGGNISLASDKSENNSVLHGKDWAVSILPVKSGVISIPPMKTGDNSITPNITVPSTKRGNVSMPPMNTGDNSLTPNSTTPSVKSVDFSIPSSTKSRNVSMPPMKTGDNSITPNSTMPSVKSADISIPPIQSRNVSLPPMKSGDVTIPTINSDISGLCGKCGDNITKREETETDLEDDNVSLPCEEMDSQNEDAREDSSHVVKSWGDLMPCEDDDDVTEQFEENDNESEEMDSVIEEDEKPDVHEIKKNTSRTPTYGHHDAVTEYYRAKTRKVHLETMVLKAKLRLEVEKFQYEKRKLELELLQLKKQ